MVWRLLKHFFKSSGDTAESPPAAKDPRTGRTEAGKSPKRKSGKKKTRRKTAPRPSPASERKPSVPSGRTDQTTTPEKSVQPDSDAAPLKRSSAKKSLTRKRKPRTDHPPSQPALNRNGLPVFHKDADLDAMFAARETPTESAPDRSPTRRPIREGGEGAAKAKRFRPRRNRHGIPIFREDTDFSVFFTESDSDSPSQRPPETRHRIEEAVDVEDFASLLEASLDGKSREVLLSRKSDALPPDRPAGREALLRYYPAPQETLDLHGSRSDEAARKTETFIRNARYKGKRTLLVIVGKGLHSHGRAVLPDVVEAKLASLKQQGLVLTFEWEKGARKKSGALVVYLPIDAPC